MRYWLFDGEDIIGPFTPQEIAARADFSASSLICPEEESQEPEQWQPAFFFKEFHFDQTTGKLTLLADEAIQKPLSAPAEISPTPKTSSVVEVEPEELPTSCTLPVVQGKQSVGFMPTLPEGTGEWAEPWVQDPVWDLETPSDEQKAQTSNDAPVPTAEELAAQSAEDSSPAEPMADVSPEDLLEEDKFFPPELNQIKPQLETNPEIDSFLQDQQPVPNALERQAVRQAWRWGIFVLVAGTALWWGWQHGEIPLSDASETRTQLVHAPVMAQPDLPAADKAPAKPATKPTVDAKEKALSIVKNYQLPENMGTISSYFDKLYQARAAQGYTSSWAVEPLHNNTYIVKYRLSKTRTEPIVYVFQADVSRGELTGALNNVALDLVGKI
ncbi:MAG: hypothetical protein MJ053_01750 [Elusimicrobiaceae bacterium]|nr:hypothetical protein [Elusimicrobiaceae bacterium]